MATISQALVAPIKWTDNVQPVSPEVEQAVLAKFNSDTVSELRPNGQVCNTVLQTDADERWTVADQADTLESEGGGA